MLGPQSIHQSNVPSSFCTSMRAKSACEVLFGSWPMKSCLVMSSISPSPSTSPMVASLGSYWLEMSVFPSFEMRLGFFTSSHPLARLRPFLLSADACPACTAFTVYWLSSVPLGSVKLETVSGWSLTFSPSR